MILDIEEFFFNCFAVSKSKPCLVEVQFYPILEDEGWLVRKSLENLPDAKPVVRKIAMKSEMTLREIINVFHVHASGEKVKK
ncbi:MAG: hypothetical protein ACD_15C00034G0002 [uncultured bacterium]|nr:MAG: hypothetical protein ACD_15C00034G0002 [uncultured bacterium]HCU71030.1 hypothetical protein [Candidatus Moranbacteria bacterium]